MPGIVNLSTEAKWLGRLLGDARDWDVFVTDMLRAPSKALGPDVAFDDIQRAAEPHRIAAYTALREALATPRYNRFQLSMRRWIQAKGWRNELRNRSLAVLLEPVSVFAGRTLTQLHRKALKKGKHLRKLQPEARHQLRIALKKLRYATDFFHASHGVSTDTKSFLGCVAALQEVLGHENDASVTAPLLSMLEQTQHERSLDRAIGVIMGWQARDRLAQPNTLVKHWHQFKATTPFWVSWPA